MHINAGPDGVWLNNDGGTECFGGTVYGNPYMFTGRRVDTETCYATPESIGLYHYRARMYNPRLGRFLQTDPIGYADSMNLYQYCGNNPVNWVDPSGLTTVRFWLTNGTKITLIDPTMEQFRDTVDSLPKGKVKKIHFSGHGWSSLMTIDPEGRGIYFHDETENKIRYSDNDGSFANHIGSKLAENAVIHLDGCGTAMGMNNIAKRLSLELPNASVVGTATFGLGNEIQQFWRGYEGSYLRIGKETHVAAPEMIYKNGKNITPPPPVVPISPYSAGCQIRIL